MSLSEELPGKIKNMKCYICEQEIAEEPKRLVNSDKEYPELIFCSPCAEDLNRSLKKAWIIRQLFVDDLERACSNLRKA